MSPTSRTASAAPPTSASELPDWDSDGGVSAAGLGGNRPDGNATAAPDGSGRTYHSETLSFDTATHNYNFGYSGSGSNSVTWSTPMLGGSRTTTRSHDVTESGNSAGSWEMYDYDQSVNSFRWGEFESDRTQSSDAEYTYNRITDSNYSYSWSNSSGAGNGSGSSYDEFYQEESFDNSSSNRQWESYSYSGYVGNSEQGTEWSYDHQADGFASAHGNHQYSHFWRNASDTHRTSEEGSGHYSGWDRYEYNDDDSYYGGTRTQTGYGLGSGSGSGNGSSSGNSSGSGYSSSSGYSSGSGYGSSSGSGYSSGSGSSSGNGSSSGGSGTGSGGTGGTGTGGGTGGGGNTGGVGSLGTVTTPFGDAASSGSGSGDGQYNAHTWGSYGGGSSTTYTQSWYYGGSSGNGSGSGSGSGYGSGGGSGSGGGWYTQTYTYGTGGSGPSTYNNWSSGGPGFDPFKYVAHGYYGGGPAGVGGGTTLGHATPIGYTTPHWPDQASGLGGILYGYPGHGIEVKESYGLANSTALYELRMRMDDHLGITPTPQPAPEPTPVQQPDIVEVAPDPDALKIITSGGVITASTELSERLRTATTHHFEDGFAYEFDFSDQQWHQYTFAEFQAANPNWKPEFDASDYNPSISSTVDAYGTGVWAAKNRFFGEGIRGILGDEYLVNASTTELTVLTVGTVTVGVLSGGLAFKVAGLAGFGTISSSMFGGAVAGATEYGTWVIGSNAGSLAYGRNDGASFEITELAMHTAGGAVGGILGYFGAKGLSTVGRNALQRVTGAPNGAISSLADNVTPSGYFSGTLDDLARTLRSVEGRGSGWLRRIADAVDDFGDDFFQLVDDVEFARLAARYGAKPGSQAFMRPGMVVLNRARGTQVLGDLVHEGTHFLDFAKGGVFRKGIHAVENFLDMTPTQIFKREIRAFRAERLLDGVYPYGSRSGLVDAILRLYPMARKPT